MNRVPDPNDSETLAKLKLDKSQVEDAITVMLQENASSGFSNTLNGIVTANNWFFLLLRQYE